MIESRRIAVFCGSRTGNIPAHEAEARTLGELLAQNGCETIIGGDRRGLMGTVTDAAIERGGRVTGLVLEAEVKRGLAHPGAILQVLDNRLSRKMAMVELSDAHITLPGGFGTLDELLQVITLSVSGKRQYKPCIVVNVEGYFDFLLQQIEVATEAGFIDPSSERPFSVVRTAKEAVLACLAALSQKG